MHELTIPPQRGARAFVLAACVAVLIAAPARAEDRVSTSEVQALQSELQENAKACRTEILPYVGGIDGGLQAIEALEKRIKSGEISVVPIGGAITSLAGFMVQTMPATEYVMFLRSLHETGLIDETGLNFLASRAIELTASLALNLSARKHELGKQKNSLTSYCQDTEAMLAKATELLTALQRAATAENTLTGGQSVPLRAPEIIVNSAAVTEQGLTCEVGANTASCVKITGGDRCSYRAWWEFPSMGELVPGATFELEARGSYACNYDAGPSPKRGPNWGTGVGYAYTNNTLMGFAWSKPGGGGLPGWVGATGCTLYFGKHGSGSTGPEVRKTCTFWTPVTFPNRRLHKAHPDHPDYQIQAVFGPVGWAANWMIR